MSDKLIITPAEAGFTIPVDSESFGSETLKLYQYLNAHVIGQERAARRIARGFSIFNAGLKPENKPIFAGILSGPTGIGKTLMGKAVSWYLIEENEVPPATIIDCTHLTEHHQTSELVGSPAGYVGYKDEPKLSQTVIDKAHRSVKWRQWIKKNSPGKTDEERERAIKRFDAECGPYFSVILVDEFDKAHRQVQLLLMPIFDEASLEMAVGGHVTNFSHSVVLLTCNIGARRIQEILTGKNKSIGFAREAMANADPEEIDDLVYRETEKTIRDNFTPEFVGRVRDQIIVFRSLTREQAGQVQELELDKVRGMVARGDRFKNRPVQLVFNGDFKEFLLDEGFNVEYGCRPIEQAVKRHVKLPLSNALDNGSVQPGDAVLFRMEGKEPKMARKSRPMPVLRPIRPTVKRPSSPLPPAIPLPGVDDESWDDCFKPVEPKDKPEGDEPDDDQPDGDKPKGGGTKP